MKRWFIFGGIGLGVLGAMLCVLAGELDSAAQEEEPLLIIYWDTAFGGRSLEVTGDLLDMPMGVDEEGEEYSWNDQISSIKVVRGTWRVFEHGRNNTELDETPLVDFDISTKNPASGWSCLVSAKSDGHVEYPTPESAGYGNDMISSIKVVSRENLPDWAVAEPRIVQGNTN